MEVKEGPYAGTSHHKVEYETGASFGTMTLTDDFPSLIKANELCNRYGFDTISAGCTIAFAIECFENELIGVEDTDGLELRWGNHEAILGMLGRMAHQQGFGATLADGAARAAERIGRGSEQYVMAIRGQEVPMHDPKYLPGLACTYKMDATPARHTQGGAYWFPHGFETPPDFDKYDYAGNGELQRWGSCMLHMVNAAGVCMFGWASYDYHFIPDFLTAITGWDFSEEECLKAGERIANLRHAFNLREGINPARIEVPGRILGRPPQTEGPLRNITVDIDAQVRAYCAAMDWDPDTALPARGRLEALGLADLIPDLHGTA